MQNTSLAEAQKWIGRLDDLKKQRGLSSDAGLARLLEFTPQYISDVKRGKPASPLLKFRILNLLVADWEMSTILDLLPQELQKPVADKLMLREQ